MQLTIRENRLQMSYSYTNRFLLRVLILHQFLQIPLSCRQIYMFLDEVAAILDLGKILNRCEVQLFKLF